MPDFREVKGGPGIKGARQKQIDGYVRNMLVSVVLTLCMGAWVIGFYLADNRPMMPWGLLFLPPILALSAIDMRSKAKHESARLRAIDNGLVEDDDGWLYNTRAKTVRDSIKYGFEPPKEF